MATKKRKSTKRRTAARRKKAEQRLPAGLGTLFAGLLLVVLAFVEGDSAWKALHDVLFGLFGCGSFVLGAAVCCLAVQYTRGEDLLPKIFKLVLGLVFACGTVIVFSDIQPQGMSAFQMTAACYANGVNAWIGGGALGALLGGPVGMTGYVLAINAIGPAYTAIISALYPALGTVLAHFFLKEKLRPTGLIGLALSIGGVIALGYTPGAALPKGQLLGFGCALLCCIGWAAEGVICTYGLQSSTVTNAQALQIRQPVSALTYAIVLLPACKDWGFTAGLFGTRALWIIALSALCGTASYLCYYKALGKLGTGKAMPLNITYAAWSLPFSYLLLHQVPGTKDILCALVVLLGALLAAYEKPQKLEKLNNK